mgnify:CR=1 FL=1|tara:strand:- start:631 stop:1359 length:729 start_codon:yes stop_codon:yes gene_type:complete
MAFFRSALVVLLVVLTSGCLSNEKLGEKDRARSFSGPQTDKYFNFIEHSTFPSAGSLYNKSGTFVGSCVLVGSHIALTAAHCITLGNLEYARFGNEEILIEEQFTHKNSVIGDDIGLLLLSEPSEHTPMSVVSDINSIPEMFPLYTISHGSGEKKISKENTFYYFGILEKRPNTIIFLPLKASVWFGDSGGALCFVGCDGVPYLLGIITHFSIIDEAIYECGARRTDNFNLYDDVWDHWDDK